MAEGLKGTVYDPPSRKLPHVAVVLDANNKVLIARAVESRQTGEDLINATFEDAAKEYGNTLTRE